MAGRNVVIRATSPSADYFFVIAEGLVGDDELS